MSRFLVQIKNINERGSWTAIASSTAVDRDGERFAPRAFAPLPPSVVVCDDHGGEPVGRAMPRYDGDRLLLDGVFASTARAQTMRTLVREGIVDSMSVVFLRKQFEVQSGVRVITDAELLGVDFVTVPSNRDALVLASRGFGRAANPTPATLRGVANDAELFLARLTLAEAKTYQRARAPRHLSSTRAWVDALIRDI